MAAKRSTTRLLSALREHLKSKKYHGDVINAYIIPTSDAHQSEYVADCDKRREFISSFSGSAGTAVVTLEQALLWTDGRYHLQASKELDQNWTLMRDGLPNVPKLEEWLAKELKEGSVVGVDPFLVSAELYEKWDEVVTNSCKSLVPIATNLVDLVWQSEAERPPRPTTPVFVLPLKYAGKAWSTKIDDVREKMKAKDCKGLVVTALDEIAWLLNLRGKDVEFNPVFYSYVIVTTDSVKLFIAKEKLTEDVRKHLAPGDGEKEVEVLEYDDVVSHLRQLLADEAPGKLWISKSSSQALSGIVPKTKLISEMCPIQMLKAVKNETEIEGMKRAHVRDAVALCQYFSWLEAEVPKGKLNEVSAADKLEQFRREDPECVDLSFATISSSGPNGAVIHYRPRPDSARSLSVDEMYLCDSGAQYWDGTTDVTRTVHFGTPTHFQKECFTRVLKGAIRLCTAVFPTKINGHRIEAMARAPLWEVGLDYLHGTGHGVGAFLNVHEGPCGINSRPAKGPLVAGMILSDEPGYYEDGSFGIRIENLVQIVETTTPYRFKDVQYLTMETITLVPIQQKMILPELITTEELAWLNDYHTKCLEVVGPALKERGKMEAYQWLKEQTTVMG